MRSSRLFKIIIERCGKKADGENGISVDGVVVETLKYLAEYSYNPDRIDAECREEFDKVKDMFDGFAVDYKKAAVGIAKLVAADEDAAVIGHCQYVNIITCLEIGGNDGDVITLDKFMNELFKIPSDAVKKFITGNAVNPDAESEEQEDIGKLFDLFFKAQDGEEGEEYAENGEERQEDDLADILAMLEARRGELREKLDKTAVDEAEDQSGEYAQSAEKPLTLKDISEKSKQVRDYLTRTVYGQDVAVNAFVSGYFQAELTAVTDLKRTRPRATFLFAGPPGVGKTFLSEQAAKALKLPFMRFDMSEYSENEANIEFCGSDKVYKNGKEGNVTGFVAKHPHAVLLFDEVEKAHLNVIHLFLQVLDAGRLRDNYTDEEVSFKDTIIIFTTNAGRGLYEDDRINLATLSRKSVMKALASDINPVTHAPMFPAAICSRFAYGNVVMFNRMSANYLVQIAEGEIARQVRGIEKNTGLKIKCDPLLPYAIIYAEGGIADARTVKGKSGAYIFQELYELFRLMQSEKNGYDISKITDAEIKLELPDDRKITSLFVNGVRSGVLVFADKKTAGECKKKIDGANVYCAHTVADAREIIAKHELSLILCDVTCGAADGAANVLNIEDVQSDGRDFLYYAAERSSLPVYVLQQRDGDISAEEFASLAGVGAKGLVSVNGAKSLSEAVNEYCAVAYQQGNLNALGRANKVLSHKTLQRVSQDGTHVEIALFDFKLITALDAGDNGSVLDGVSKPDVKFADVIGAKDAKEELSYFIEFLKNPAKFIKRGVRAPKGILLYGPPGTGKTLLAKAMAGESDVTFIRAEGNQFLKRYVGEGAESVHKLFNTARKYAPSILFIDEIDAIAKNRGENTTYSDDVLTSFLTEMDGFNTNSDRPVFVLAATNYGVEQGSARSLDAALLRRFDRKIYVDLPNKEERILFIKRKLEKISGNKVSDGEIENIAVRSTGTSLADLDSVFELALRNVLKTNDYALNDKVIEDAFETFNSGSIKKWNKNQLLRTARHEAGHALMCYLGGETPSYLTVVARGSHGGYMQFSDNEDKGTYTKKELLSRVRTALGGRAAEVVYYGEEDGVSTGASGDLRTATNIIENMICSYGMDETVGLGSIELKNLSSGLHYTRIVERINELLACEFNSVKELISYHRAAIDGLVEALLEKNSLKSNEIEEILKQNI